MDIVKVEAFLRFSAILVLLTTALLVRFNTQTKLIFAGYTKTAGYKDLNALYVLVFIDLAAAGYNVVQLVVRGLLSSHLTADVKPTYKYLAWVSFLFDQGVVYTVFAANSAAMTASLFAVTGVDSFFWMKLCDRFTRFCFQIGGALLCGYVAFLLMAFVSSLSALSLFRLYSPKHFLALKGKQ